jgi:perosamine synthetase
MISAYDPWIGEEEAAAVRQAVLDGEISGTFGQTIRRFEEQFATLIGCRHGVAVTSGTTALHLAVAAYHFSPGAEILLSASTNIATALAIVHNNLIPVPVDSEPGSWNLDPELIEDLITPKTRGIIPVHLFGHPARMDRIRAIATKHRLKVIEDCAESHGASWQGTMTGAWGEMGCFSFYANKIITTGEGGMILTNDDSLAEELRLLRNLAFKEPRFLHDKCGFNFRMTGYQAAMGLVQISRLSEVLDRKRKIADWYRRSLQKVAGITLPEDCTEGRHVYWVYGILLDSGFDRGEIMRWLNRAGVETRTFFHPMNQQPCLQNILGFRSRPCPIAEGLGERGFYLPSGPNLSEQQVIQVSGLVGKAMQIYANR